MNASLFFHFVSRGKFLLHKYFNIISCFPWIINCSSPVWLWSSWCGWIPFFDCFVLSSLSFSVSLFFCSHRCFYSFFRGTRPDPLQLRFAKMTLCQCTLKLIMAKVRIDALFLRHYCSSSFNSARNLIMRMPNRDTMPECIDSMGVSVRWPPATMRDLCRPSHFTSYTMWHGMSLYPSGMGAPLPRS